MKIIRFFKEQRKSGFGTALKKLFQYGLQKIIGVSEFETKLTKVKNENDTLFYFLNTYADITAAKPATGNLRLLQLCEAKLLAIVDLVLKKNNLQYWMIAGTLLGAVRHKGFIPWDDDIDICMLRKDFNRALEVLPDELSKIGLKFFPQDSISSLGISNMHGGIWIDIFPVDSVKYNPHCADETTLRSQLNEYNNYFAMSKLNHVPKKEIIEQKNKIIKGLEDDEHADIYFTGIEFSGKCILYPSPEIIFPIEKTQFERYMLNAPHNSHEALRQQYGDYLRFPREGVCHHIDVNGLNYDALMKIKAEIDPIYDDLILQD